MLEPAACGILVSEGDSQLIIQEDGEFGLGFDKGTRLSIEWIGDKPYIVMPYAQKIYSGSKQLTISL